MSWEMRIFGLSKNEDLNNQDNIEYKNRGHK